jgi:DNA gyrase/topoisomerase IV subunit B
LSYLTYAHVGRNFVSNSNRWRVGHISGGLNSFGIDVVNTLYHEFTNTRTVKEAEIISKSKQTDEKQGGKTKAEQESLLVASPLYREIKGGPRGASIRT